MNLNRKIASGIITLLIIGCLGASLMMVAPVEDVDAWPYHPCCEWKVEWFTIGGNIVEVSWQDCDNVFHGHAWSCGFTCPSS